MATNYGNYNDKKWDAVSYKHGHWRGNNLINMMAGSCRPKNSCAPNEVHVHGAVTVTEVSEVSDRRT